MSAFSWCPDGAGHGRHLAAPAKTPSSSPLPTKSYTQKVDLVHVLAADTQLLGHTITVGGWVKTGRPAQKNSFCFLELNDGSTIKNLQVLIDADVVSAFPGEYKIADLVKTGACIMIEGTIVPCEGKGQNIEMKGTRLKQFGPCNAEDYPIPKKALTLEHLRTHSHLRVRTNVIAAVGRVRNHLAWATHSFFQGNGFLYVHTPLISGSDCEGAGEMFQVTTLLGDAEKEQDPPPTAETLQDVKERVSAAGFAVKEAKEAMKAGGEKSAVDTAVAALKAVKSEEAELTDKALVVGGIKRLDAAGAVDYTKDFFGKKSYLTVSGQLDVETWACGIGNVYTFGPTFRAEYSFTSRHLAEFWMIEPEIAFADLQDDMRLAEDYVKYCCRHVLDNCLPDLEFLAKYNKDEGLLGRLQDIASSSFARISYTDAILLLEKHIKEGIVKERRKADFENEVYWGCDLASEHERYIAEHEFKKPTIVYNYPKEMKAFYMRLNDDQKTVAAMDVLVPKIGELIGGSQREERMDVLEKRCKESGLDIADYAFYTDLRRYGTVMHSGFGLGFERLVMLTTSMENVRDVIPFPRAAKTMI